MQEEFRHDEHPLSRKPWAVWSVMFVILLFGTFWYYQRSQQNNSIEVSQPLSVQRPSLAPNAALAEQPLSLTDLQAAALNTAVPNYADNF